MIVTNVVEFPVIVWGNSVYPSVNEVCPERAFRPVKTIFHGHGS